ncbi:MAG: coenzyme F420-0:L-glutamate ligase [Patescibacteria group bacterium]
MELYPNRGKNLVIAVDGIKYARYPVKTPLVTEKDRDPVFFVKKQLPGILEKGDVIFISEKIISIMQGRAYQINGIKPTKIAKILSKFVQKRPGGIGLGMPETMQLAIDEAGLPRIILAALFSLLTKPFGLKGVFYIIAGDQARAVDGPTQNTIPPYNNYAVKAPLKPDKVAEEISKEIGAGAAIVDVNDWGVRILGKSRIFKINEKFLSRALKDNPLGQCDESTPIGIIRKIK